MYVDNEINANIMQVTIASTMYLSSCWNQGNLKIYCYKT